jgi:AcrR family transcriptional regulator
MLDMQKTKRKVIDAAVPLFNTKGFSGTSVRDISSKAGVNVSLISYYFGSKKGLLEELMVMFWEGYLKIGEGVYQQREILSPKACLQKYAEAILTYQAEDIQLSRFILREVTVDSLLVREIMSTYLSKEKFILKAILEAGMKQNDFRKLPLMITIMQIKGMLTTPFLHPQYVSKVLLMYPQEKYFTGQYIKEVKRWIEADLSPQRTEKYLLQAK